MPSPRQTGLPGLPGLRSTHPAAISSRRGGLYGCPGRTAGISGLSVIAARPWRHVGMPPYDVRRRCGAKRGLLGRLIAAPTAFGGDAAGSAGLLGRPYRPPLRGAFDLVRRAGCPHPAKPGCRDCRACRQRILPLFPAVGVACMAARTALPELVGFRSSRPSYGGMGACRPTASGGGAAENAGCSGGYAIRPYGCTRAGSRCRGALYMRPGRTAGIVGLAVHRTRSWRHVGMPPYEVRRRCGAKRGLLGRLIAAPTAVGGGAAGNCGPVRAAI